MSADREGREAGIERLLAYARQSDRDELADIRRERNEIDVRRALLSQRSKRLRDRLTRREMAAAQLARQARDASPAEERAA